MVRRADGQTIQLTPLLYGTLELIDSLRTVTQIAEGLGERIGRSVSIDNVRYRVTEKLRPCGLLKDASGRDPEVRKANPLLSLRLRLEITNERWTLRLAAPFAALFRPWVVVPVVVGVFAVLVWVLGIRGLGLGARELLYSPKLMLATFGLMILSASFHELGHAAACRYSGGKPGVMGAASTSSGLRSTPTSPTPTASTGPAGSAPTSAASTSTPSSPWPPSGRGPSPGSTPS